MKTYHISALHGALPTNLYIHQNQKEQAKEQKALMLFPDKNQNQHYSTAEQTGEKGPAQGRRQIAHTR